MVPRREKGNVSPYSIGAGVESSNGKRRGQKRRYSTLGEKKLALDLLDQRLDGNQTEGSTLDQNSVS